MSRPAPVVAAAGLVGQTTALRRDALPAQSTPCLPPNRRTGLQTRPEVAGRDRFN